METAQKTRLHPLIGGAAAALIVVSLTGVAAITGLIPGTHGTNAPPGPDIAAAQAQQGYNTTAQNNSNVPFEQNRAPLAQNAREMNAPPRAVSEAQYDRPAPVAAICNACGRVENIREVRHAAKTSGVGIAAGAVLGGVLGNQIGSGNGRSLATVAGAVGGGFAGNEVEKRTHTTVSYVVVVRLENGRVREFTQSSAPGWRIGDEVRVVHGALRSRV